MRIAYISDIHGNLHALHAVLEEIRRLGADQIICGGDIVDPLLTSKEVWELLKSEKIPVIRGNHEDYMVSYFSPERKSTVRKDSQYLPVQLVARHLGSTTAAELGQLPLSLEIAPKPGCKLYLCHASPVSNSRSFVREPIEGAFAEAIEATGAQMIVSGHIHEQWNGQWNGRKLIIAGSVGLPLMGEPRPQFALLDFDGREWKAELRTVAYDFQAALGEYERSGAFAQGGPIAWLLHDELRTGQKRLADVMRAAQKRQPRPESLEDWTGLVREHLEKMGTWSEIRKRIP